MSNKNAGNQVYLNTHGRLISGIAVSACSDIRRRQISAPFFPLNPHSCSQVSRFDPPRYMRQ